ncbi:M28 family peptidase [Niastella caeni]|uniref:M28 family peptidase n=1 Tax=Niastella caeni TaxID=2569763 RepID=A0A4S8HZ22_9BACT|nr:M28 family peptidase [Niastella caeni]THU40795.1 M28 family peptidase [Niastella caeni]
MRKSASSLFASFITICFLLLLSHPVFAQAKKAPVEAIRQSDLKRDLFLLADDHFRGREAGTLDELKASAWIAEEARKAGLEPAGDDGTYFQFFSLIRERVSGSSTIKIGDRSFNLWKDVVVYEPSFATVDAPVVFIDDADTVAEETIKGKVVALQFTPKGLTDPRKSIAWRYSGFVIAAWARKLGAKGVKAIVFVSDDLAEQAWPRAAQYSNRGSYQIEGSLFTNRQQLKGIPIIWVRKEALNLVREPDQRLKATIYSESFTYPSVNVVAKVKGADPVLSKEYVLFSGHQDHDGVRAIEGVKDSILNGADDNATVSVALLAIGRAFRQQPGRRSALFVWHGSEERGLFGSTWYAEHPTVPRESLVAVLNGDMIGMNAPDSAALLGIIPPHLNSSDLVNIALLENARGPKFKLDTEWDKATHFESWYFRSDHYPYAKKNIPALFFSTLPHPLYHTPADESTAINIEKLTKMTRWMYATGFAVANAAKRPQLEAGFKLER